MSNAPHIEKRKDYTGRILFVVAGMLSTYDEAEATALTITGLLAIECPLTREIAAAGIPFSGFPQSREAAPNGRGTLKKFAWE